jgi:hypothetical protein
MSAGDRTKRLTAEIRDILSMNDITKTLKNDYLLYNYLTKHQYNFMLDKRASKRFFEITLANGTDSYALDVRLFSVLSFEDGSDNENTYIGCYKEQSHTIEIASDVSAIETGDKIVVSGFIKPVYDYDNGLTGGNRIQINDRITESYDPIIENDYDDLLVEAVLSEFRHLNQYLKKIDTIMEEVERRALRLASQKRFAGTKCS